jgi:hypothetical protein
MVISNHNFNINSMTINNIIDFIRDGLYLNENNEIIEIEYNFKGNITEFNNIGNDYIKILKDKFKDNHYVNNNEIAVIYNNITFNIKIINNNENEIYWNVNII